MGSGVVRAGILILIAAAIFAAGLIAGAMWLRRNNNSKISDGRISMERAGAVTFKGNPLTLIGEAVKVGDVAPDCELVANDLSKVKISDYRGKVLVLSAVPSLDTPVCSTETRRFNKEASGLGSDVVIVTVSMDLPFAQKRWCAAEGIERVVTVSDYMNADFGKKYGVLIKELHLLARTVFVVDKEGIVRYIQQVKEVASEPDYEKVLAAVRELKK